MIIKYTARDKSGYKVIKTPINSPGDDQQEKIEKEDVSEKKIINPRMMTVKEVAATGILSEYAIRLLIKENRLQVLRVGKKALINYERLVEDLDALRLDKGVDYGE